MIDIQTKIAWLRCFDDDEVDQRVAARCADTMEKMLAVVEAANACITAWDDAKWPPSIPLRKALAVLNEPVLEEMDQTKREPKS